MPDQNYGSLRQIYDVNINGNKYCYLSDEELTGEVDKLIPLSVSVDTMNMYDRVNIWPRSYKRNRSWCGKMFYWSGIVLTSCCAAILGAMYVYHYVRRGTNRNDGGISSYTILLTASNEYGTVSKANYPYSFLTDSIFIETYKNHTMNIISENVPSHCQYLYTIATENSLISQGVSSFGLFYFQPISPGKYDLTVQILCSNLIVQSFSLTLWSKYVRRELMDLTDEDREIFLDAMITLWQVNTRDGKLLYGDKYKSLNYLAVIHNDAGGNFICDEFHGDIGFINNHVMLGAYLEQSLQLVDPRTCLHYMAYYYYFSSPRFEYRKQ